jgi:hypothetical protein
VPVRGKPGDVRPLFDALRGHSNAYWDFALTIPAEAPDRNGAANAVSDPRVGSIERRS